MNSNSDRLAQIHKMLDAMLRSEGLTEWVGGYVYGRTSNDDPFIILYPAAEHLKEKVCRVYEHAFKRLPPFIPTDVVPADTENNPSKGQAERTGIYHACPRFKIVMYLGKDTQMGREKRFGDVLYVPPYEREKPVAPAPVESPPPPPTPRPKVAEDPEDVKAHWRVQAATATEPLMFDTAIVKLEPWFQDSNKVEEFRELIFGAWDDGRTGAYVVGLEAYAAQRRQLNGSTPARQAHKVAKAKALAAYGQALGSPAEAA